MALEGCQKGAAGIRIAALFITGLLIFQAGELSCQEFLVINNNRELFRVDAGNCTARFVAFVRLPGGGSISDITYTPDGRLWGITTDGELLLIDEVSGETELAYSLPNGNSPFFTSLVADNEGRIYTAGGNGDLYVFDTQAMAHTYLGDIGYGSAGDLTFYQGQLIMASTVNWMIDVDLDDPVASSLRMNFNVGGQIFGIVTFVEDCDNTVTYATNDAANGGLYQIDFATDQLSLACNLGIRIFGAASRLEFLAADPVVIEQVVTTPTGCASPLGAIEVTASGGNGALAYSLDSMIFQPGGTFAGLSPGDYTIYVQDSRGCGARQMARVEAIGEAPAITRLAVEEDSCGLGIGAITVDAEGGVLPYRYVLDGEAPVSSPLFAGLPGGAYTVSVIDGQGCIDSQTVVIPGEPGPEIERAGLMPCGPSQNSLTVEAAGGAGRLLYSIGGGPAQASPEFSGLDAGAFLISVADEAGCTDVETVTIPAVEALVFTLLEAKACGAGNSYLAAAAAGGSGALVYSLNGGPPQASGNFENLSAGAYTLLAMDENGCTATGAISIPEYDPPRILGMEVAPSQCGAASGRLKVETEGGAMPFLYTLSGTEQTAPEFTGLPPGRFLLTILDAEGCSVEDSVTVALRCPIYLPNAFSPNDDGRNDRFELYSGAEVQIIAFRIFNRWGGLVYEQKAFGSSDDARYWDGRFRGEPAPAGAYAFYIELVNAAGEEELHEGEVLLVR